MELDVYWPRLSEIHDDITDFEETMFLGNPLRAQKLWGFLWLFSEYTDIRVKIFQVVKSWNDFWSLADKYGFLREDPENWKYAFNDAKNQFLNRVDEWPFTEEERNMIWLAIDQVFWLTEIETEREWFLKRARGVIKI